MTEPRRLANWPQYAAALWALVFALFHVVWAAGVQIGLDEDLARAAFAHRWFLVYDLIVAAMCAFAVLVALALAQPHRRLVPRGLLAFSACTGTGLLLVRAGSSLIQNGYLLVTGRFEFQLIIVWEIWFYAGAILFGVSTWRYFVRARRMRGEQEAV